MKESDEIAAVSKVEVEEVIAEIEGEINPDIISENPTGEYGTDGNDASDTKPENDGKEIDNPEKE